MRIVPFLRAVAPIVLPVLLLPVLPALAGCGADPSDPAGSDPDASGDDGGDPIPTAAPQTVELGGVVETVAGAPFGLGRDAEGSLVSGSLTYDAAVPDLDTDDLQRGWYPHADGGGDFSLAIGEHVVTGSGRPSVEVLDHDPDRFVYEDGPASADDDRYLAVDGVDAPDVVVALRVDGTWDGWLPSDALPAPFQAVDTAVADHTFVLSDAHGTVFLRLSRLTPGGGG